MPSGAWYTFVQLVKDYLKALLKRNGISWTLEGQAKFPLLHTPVMEYGIHLVVDQTLLNGTFKHGLHKKTKVSLGL